MQEQRKFDVRPCDKEMMNNLKKTTGDAAEHLLCKEFPQKIFKLEDLLKDPLFNKKDLKDMHSAVSGKVVNESSDGQPAAKRQRVERSEGSSDDMVPSNQLIMDMLAMLKPEVISLVDSLQRIKMWIQLNIPRIEDGNNFGVGIQEETVSELSRAEDSAFAVLESMTKYYVSRAKLVTKVLKYPRVSDYILAIEELDEKEYANVRLCAHDLRNNYSILHDMIMKNIEKIRKPRTENGYVNMY